MNPKIIYGICIVGLLSWVIITYPEIYNKEPYPDYDDNVKPFLDSCSLDDVPIKRGALKWYMICLSYKVFDNERVIPFFLSFILLNLTLVFGMKVTNSKLGGMITMFTLMTSGIFFKFDSSSTYDQTWSVLLLSSIILSMGNRVLSPSFLWVLSVLAKPYAIVFLPIIIYFGFRGDKTRNDKMIFLIGFIISSSILASVYLTSSPLVSFGGDLDFNQDELVESFYSWFFYFDSDWIIILLPIILFLLIKSIKYKIRYSDAILFGIGLIIISIPLIHGFTNQIHHSYRFAPLIILIGVGLALVIQNNIPNKKKFSFLYDESRR